MVEINEFDKSDQMAIRRFVLNIQNNEFGLGFDELAQPDLIDTEKFYRGGGFWIANVNNEIVGTIGLQIIDGKNAALRKMFVKKELRGKELNIAQKLFDTLTNFASNKKKYTIWLDTPDVAIASHKFYERNGFQLSDKMYLPESYTFPDKNSKIYKLTVG